jgi:hypothetical protein
VSGPTNENPSDRREGFCCLCVRKDQSTAKHSVIRLHLLQGPAAKHFLTLKFMSEGKVPVEPPRDFRRLAQTEVRGKKRCGMTELRKPGMTPGFYPGEPDGDPRGSCRYQCYSCQPTKS